LSNEEKAYLQKLSRTKSRAVVYVGGSKIAKRELRANKTNINGYKLYDKTNELISDFKDANGAEFNRVNSLKLNRQEIDVYVYISFEDGPVEGNSTADGTTKYQYEKGKYFTDPTTGKTTLVPISVKGNQIKVTLYNHGQNLEGLSNEFGDAIFAVENPGTSYNETRRKPPISYWDKSSTKFSFKYSDYIMGKGPKPDPNDPQTYR
jgi:hypothetical protein